MRRVLLSFGSLFGRPGGGLLSHVLGRSTIGAEGFHGRVRDGIGCYSPRHDHQVVGTEAGNEVLFVVGARFAACWGSGPCMRRKVRDQAERAISTG